MVLCINIFYKGIIGSKINFRMSAGNVRFAKRIKNYERKRKNDLTRELNFTFENKFISKCNFQLNVASSFFLSTKKVSTTFAYDIASVTCVMKRCLLSSRAN